MSGARDRRFANARIVAPDGVVDGWLEVAGGVVTALGEGAATEPAEDLAGAWLVPGFVDIHVHGGGGGSFQSGDPTDVAAAARFHRSHGTTTLLASLVTDRLDTLARSLARLAEAVDEGLVAGIHLEGPFLSPARCGAHDPALLCDPEPEALDALLAAGRGRVAMVTLAPERAGGPDAVRRVVDCGAVAAIGHTDATYEATAAAVDAGARVATHLFNAMPPIHHRAPGPVLALLDDDRVVAELINDGVHLHPALVRHVVESAAPGRTALVTDAIALAGLGDGEMTLGKLSVVVRDGVASLADGRSLAGSVLTLDRAVRLAVAAGVSVPDAVRAASTAPADAVGLGERAGRIRVGAVADLVVLDAHLQVRDVLAGGRSEPPA